MYCSSHKKSVIFPFCLSHSRLYAVLCLACRLWHWCCVAFSFLSHSSKTTYFRYSLMSLWWRKTAYMMHSPNDQNTNNNDDTYTPDHLANGHTYKSPNNRQIRCVRQKFNYFLWPVEFFSPLSGRSRDAFNYVETIVLDVKPEIGFKITTLSWWWRLLHVINIGNRKHSGLLWLKRCKRITTAVSFLSRLLQLRLIPHRNLPAIKKVYNYLMMFMALTMPPI